MKTVKTNKKIAHKYSNNKENKYYEDFKKALRKHTENYRDDQYAIMKRRFIERIKKLHKTGKSNGII